LRYCNLIQNIFIIIIACIKNPLAQKILAIRYNGKVSPVINDSALVLIVLI
jgi:hypothetical protein